MPAVCWQKSLEWKVNSEKWIEAFLFRIASFIIGESFPYKKSPTHLIYLLVWYFNQIFDLRGNLRDILRGDLRGDKLPNEVIPILSFAKSSFRRNYYNSIYSCYWFLCEPLFCYQICYLVVSFCKDSTCEKIRLLRWFQFFDVSLLWTIIFIKNN